MGKCLVGSTRVWDATTGQTIRTFQDSASRYTAIWSAIFLSSGERILTGSEDGKARLYCTKSGVLLKIYGAKENKHEK